VGNDHSRKEKRLPYRTRQYARTGLHGQLTHSFDLQVESWRLRVPSLKVEAHRFEDEDGWTLPAYTWLLREDYWTVHAQLWCSEGSESVRSPD